MALSGSFPMALCGHKWRLADIMQNLALNGLSDAMALFPFFSIFARFSIIQPKRFILCFLPRTYIFYLMRVVFKPILHILGVPFP